MNKKVLTLGLMLMAGMGATAQVPTRSLAS